VSTIDGITSYEAVASQQPTYGNSDLGQEAFLTLLVTQLQHQDPLDPQDNEAFVAQLAQFSSLEQLTTANGSLESLYVAMASMNNASMTQLLGQNVRAYGDTFSYDGEGPMDLGFESTHELDGATLTVMDESGSVVWTESLGAFDAGENDIIWDGRTISGEQAEAGTYTFSVTSQGDFPENGEIATIVEGEIDGMAFDGGTPVPSMGGAEIAIGDIIEVFTPDDEGDEEDSE
jgi:flagellar basal-body rod modification protein FlgD